MLTHMRSIRGAASEQATSKDAAAFQCGSKPSLPALRVLHDIAMQSGRRSIQRPAPRDLNPASRSGIIGFTHVLSDDGRFAIVEFTARTRSALLPILNDKSILTFLKGRDKREDIEALLKNLFRGRAGLLIDMTSERAIAITSER